MQDNVLLTQSTIKLYKLIKSIDKYILLTQLHIKNNKY